MTDDEIKLFDIITSSLWNDKVSWILNTGDLSFSNNSLFEGYIVIVTLHTVVITEFPSFFDSFSLYLDRVGRKKLREAYDRQFRHFLDDNELNSEDLIKQILLSHNAVKK